MATRMHFNYGMWRSRYQDLREDEFVAVQRVRYIKRRASTGARAALFSFKMRRR